MPPILIGVIVLFFLVALFFVFRQNNEEEKVNNGKPDSQNVVFEFEQDREGFVATARRRIRFVMPPQKNLAARQRITIQLEPLPKLDQLEIPSGKGIEALQLLIANPVARMSETYQQVYDFDPPLSVTVYYTKEDTAETTFHPDGTPRLSIVSGYESQEGWRFERLDTRVQADKETGGGTLTAELRTLHPNDPLWTGRP